MRVLSALVLSLSLMVSVSAQTPPTTPPAPAPEAPALSELTQLRVEIHALRLAIAERDSALAQSQTKLQQIALTQERADLDGRIKKEHPGWHMDWAAGRLVRDEGVK